MDPDPAAPVELRVPARVASSTPSFYRGAAWVGLGLGVLCLPIAAVLLVSGRRGLGAAVVGAAVVWAGLGALARWYAGSSADARAGFDAGRVLVGVGADAVVLDGRPLPAAEIGALELHWFSLTERHAFTPGAAVARGLIRAAQNDAGGNLGLAVVARPRADPAAFAVGKAHHLIVEGDLQATAHAVAAFAHSHGIALAGSPTPPPLPAPPLPDTLIG